jgi:S-formylglutathione hydrolase FrmB
MKVGKMAGGEKACAASLSAGGPRWQRNDPTVQAAKPAGNNTQLWLYSGAGRS